MNRRPASRVVHDEYAAHTYKSDYKKISYRRRVPSALISGGEMQFFNDMLVKSLWEGSSIQQSGSQGF